MSRLQPQFYKNFDAGMVTNVNENVTPPGSVALALNMQGDEELGSLTTRKGTQLIGTQVQDNKTCLGLHNFRDSDGTNNALIAFFNNSGDTQSVGTKVGTGSITGLTAQTASKKHRMLTYLDSVLIVNGTDAPKSYNGATVITTGGAFDLANIPFSEPSLCIEWLDRVYLAGDTSNPDRIYYSSTPVSGAVSWTSGNGFIDLEPEDGAGNIKGFGKVPGFLLIFKERGMKRWNFDSAFPESLIDIGAPNQESIISSGGLCAFYSASSKDAKGFFITNGGRPQSISHDRPRSIKKWIDAIPQAAEANIAGHGTSRSFMWSVGDLTVDGRTYSNVVFYYNYILDQWSVRSYPTQLHFFSSYVDSNNVNTIAAGDDDGNVIEIDADTYTNHDGSKIYYEVLFQDEDFQYNQVKEISDSVVVNSKNLKGGEIVLIEKKDSGERTHTGKIDGRISELELKEAVKANIIQIGVRGEVTGAEGVLKEVEIPNIDVKNSYVWSKIAIQTLT